MLPGLVEDSSEMICSRCSSLYALQFLIWSTDLPQPTHRLFSNLHTNLHGVLIAPARVSLTFVLLTKPILQLPLTVDIVIT